MHYHVVKGFDLLRLVGKLKSNHLDAMTWGCSKFGKRFAIGKKVYFFFDPESAMDVSKENSGALIKPGTLAMFLGINTVTANGIIWRKHRRLIAPQFHKRNIEQAESLIKRHAVKLSKKWGSGLNVRDGAKDCSIAIFELASELFFGALVQEHSDKIAHDLRILTDVVTSQSTSWIKLPLYVPLPKHIKAQKAKARLQNIVSSIISEKRQKHASGMVFDDLLSHLMSAKDPETQQMFSDQELRDEVSTLLTVGHDTTASALMWALYFLAKHPEIQERLVTELKAEKNPLLLDCIIDESMRIFPAVPVLTRLVVKPVRIGGIMLPKGAMLIISPYITQRDDQLWLESEKFDPDRFKQGRPPNFSFFPFGVGARACAGESLARRELQIFISELVLNWRWKLHPQFKLRTICGVTLSPERLELLTYSRSNQIKTP